VSGGAGELQLGYEKIYIHIIFIIYIILTALNGLALEREEEDGCERKRVR
jgi:hypothetical protein